ncbi:MAG: hypothetical protein CTY15_11710 [Methylocystis sp.]|nr:MAG: hypothetical protein CTY15_11710 [Methylocystis sp.]
MLRETFLKGSDMRRLCAILASLVAATSAFAEEQRYERVISAVSMSFEPAVGEDRVLLILGPKNRADLYIYRGVDKTDAPLTPAFVKEDVTWNGPKASGRRPSLEVSDKGSLLIHSGESFNQRHYDQTLTVVFRDNNFLIVGVTREEEGLYDYEHRRQSCDLNLLTGKGKENGKPVRVKAQPIKLSEWSDFRLPHECAI